jgi:endonuclease YncB( thermonuclease family)
MVRDRRPIPGLPTGCAILLFLALLAAAGAPARAAGDIRSYAIVRDDATLLVRNTVIRFYGVYVPRSNRVCAFQLRPTQCGTRAARALRLKIQGFVTCRPVQRQPDGSLAAFCFIDAGSALRAPVDLGGYLISQGLAVAGPGAPFDYHTRERIARSRGFGIWGNFVDSFR